MSRFLLWAAVVIGLGVLPAKAALMIYDGFNYPVSASLTGQNGGFGFSQGWQSSASTVNGGSLTFGALGTSGNSVAAHAPTESLNRDLSVALGAPGTTAYISF